MNSTLNTAKTAVMAPLMRTLFDKWDMLAVISLLLSSSAYSIYAISQMTGF